MPLPCRSSQGCGDREQAQSIGTGRQPRAGTELAWPDPLLLQVGRSGIGASG